MAGRKRLSFKNRDRYIKLGLTVSYYRKLAGMTQDQLAEAAGLSRSFISLLEAPNTVVGMSLEVLFNLSDALGISPERILDLDSKG